MLNTKLETVTFENVVNSFSGVVENLVTAIDDFPWENETAYAHWLAQTFYLVRHTTRFLNLTAGGMGLEFEEFHQFLLKHLREETGHEKMALQDLEKGLGWSIQQTPERIESALMLQSQYYWIRTTPFAHFGFFWVLETLSVERGAEVIERVRKSHGHECSLFLEHHSDADVTHTKTIRQKVENIPAPYLWHIQQNIVQTGHLYTTMLREISRLPNIRRSAA